MYTVCWQLVRGGTGWHSLGSNMQSCLRSIHLPRVRAAGPEVRAHIVVAELCIEVVVERSLTVNDVKTRM